MWERAKTYILPALLVIGSFVGCMAGAAWILRDRTPVPPAPTPIVPVPDKNRPIILPEKIECELHDWVDIRAKSIGPVEWNVPKSLLASCKIHGDELTFKACKEGAFEISASTVVDCKPSKAAWVTVVVGKIVPPGPDPDPKPGPEPTDSIWKALKAAWLSDVSESKRADVGKLASLYLAGQSYAKDEATATGKALNDLMTKARKDLIGERLAGVREVLNAESDRLLPRLVEKNLDAESRDLCAKTFARYADLLKRLP